MISSNGAVVRGFDGQLLDRRFLPVETARELCIALRGYGTLVFTFDREGTRCVGHRKHGTAACPHRPLGGGEPALPA